MNKKIYAAAGAIALVIGGMAIWHFNGHPGTEHDSHVGDSAEHAHEATPPARADSAPEHGHDEHADHAGHGASNEKLTLNDGKKWATDEPLRAGMSRMHSAVIPVYKAFNDKTITAEQAQGLATTIKTEIDLIFQNCKLEPKADAALHIVLAELLGGKAAIEANPSDPEGVPRIVNALHSYSEYFDHPNF